MSNNSSANQIDSHDGLVSPYELEPHHTLSTFMGDNAAAGVEYFCTLSAKRLAQLLTEKAHVEAISVKNRYQVIRGWETVLAARKYKIPHIKIDVAMIDEENLSDHIYLDLMLGTHIAQGRELNTFRHRLNREAIKVSSTLLSGTIAQRRVNGMPTSSAYRKLGPRGSTRGRKKKVAADNGAMDRVDNSSTLSAKETIMGDDANRTGDPT